MHVQKKFLSTLFLMKLVIFLHNAIYLYLYVCLQRERDILADDKRSLEQDVKLVKQEVLRMQQKVEDLEVNSLKTRDLIDSGVILYTQSGLAIPTLSLF